MIKICKKCGELREHKIRNDRGGKPQSHCVECQKKYRKEHYEANKQKYIDKAKYWRQEYTKEIQTMKEVPCVDCGIQYPYYVMQFDHLEDKEFSLAIGSTKSREKVLAEIAKCEVVCANCHAERTHQRRLAALV